MIDSRLLSWDFDEEAQGFGEPLRAAPRRMGKGERVAVALIALGLLALTLQWVGGILLGTWTGLVAGFGLVVVGSSALSWFRWRGTTPGIKQDGTFFRAIQNRGLLAWGLGILLTGFYVVLYFYDVLQADHGLPALLERPMRGLDPLAHVLTGAAADRWFLYGFLYTLAICVMGVRMLMKYRHNRYQQVRTASVVFFQFGFAFLLPHLLKLFHSPEFYFTYFWPLKPQYLFPKDVATLTGHGALGIFMVFWGAVATFIATPVLTYFYGKRWYCSWVCGCGGLAETFGDPWRQQSDKSTRSWKVERWLVHGVLVFVTITTILLWINSATKGRVLGTASQGFAKAYGFWIGALFSGVVGVGFYPLLGNRVWCRFGCPMAAILGLFQRAFSRFRITTNGDQCMSCGNCSTYCEMGIDVRAYAERGENVVRASCVGCGVCSAVCPRGVLKLENGMTHRDRYDGAESPARALLDSIKDGAVYPERRTTMAPDDDRR